MIYADEPSAYDWTREDYDFVSRVARAAQRCGLDDSSRDTMWSAFGRCSNLWGPKSPPALGCLLALACDAYAMPGMYVGANITPKGATWWALYGGGCGPFGVLAGLPQTKAEALVAALEAAP